MSEVMLEYKGIKLEWGLWYDPYTRIFTIGGSSRIAEVSNYPRVYRDRAKHLDGKGELLPGAFPRWLEYPTLQPVTDTSAIKFSLDAVPKPIDLKEASILDEAEKLSNKPVADLKAQISRGELIFPAASAKRQLIYIRYERRFK